MLIGIKENGKVILAYSSFDGYSPIDIADMSLPENTGVWRVKKNPHTIMGCCSTTAESDAYRYEEELFAGDIGFDRLSCEIVPAMEEFTDGKEYIYDGKGRYEKFLIAQKDKLFRITGEHIVFEEQSYTVMSGCGEDLAKSIMYATDGEPAMDRIRKAFEFAAYKRQCECYPITVLDTETGKLETLTRERQTGEF